MISYKARMCVQVKILYMLLTAFQAKLQHFSGLCFVDGWVTLKINEKLKKKNCVVFITKIRSDSYPKDFTTDCAE